MVRTSDVGIFDVRSSHTVVLSQIGLGVFVFVL